MITNRLMIDHKEADLIVGGRKTIDIRKKDRHWRVGDRIVYTATVQGRPAPHHYINSRIYKVEFVLGKNDGLKDGYIALCISEVRV